MGTDPWETASLALVDSTDSSQSAPPRTDQQAHTDAQVPASALVVPELVPDDPKPVVGPVRAPAWAALQARLASDLEVEPGTAPDSEVEPDAEPDLEVELGLTAEPEREPKGRGKRRRGRAAAAEVPADLRQVPAPGGRYRGGRGRHVVVKTVAFLMFALLLAGGGVWAGAAGSRALQRPPVLTISEEEAARFDLDEFPVSGAAAFAQRYVELCLTSMAHQDADAEKARVAQLRAMATSGALTGCGVGSRSVDTVVVSTAFAGVTGVVQERESARYVEVQAVLVDGRTLAVTVPVWTDPDDPGSAFMVIGPIGNDPLPAVVDLPALRTGTADGELARTLSEQLFDDFFAAWGSSSSTVLARFAAGDATTAVTTGLAGALGTPKVGSVTVPLPEDAVGGQGEWELGDRTTATVQVTWTLPGATAGQLMAYRVDITLSSSGWVVVDIAGGAADSAGAHPDPATAVATAAPTPVPTSGAQG